MLAFILLSSLPLLLVLRIYLLLPRFQAGPPPKRHPSSKCSLGVFLGSGMSVVYSFLRFFSKHDQSEISMTSTKGLSLMKEIACLSCPTGGHTAEMKTLLSTIDFNRYTPRKYIHCQDDILSLRIISTLESRYSPSSSTSASSGPTQLDPTAQIPGENHTAPIKHDYTVLSLPRARRVGEKRLSTIISSMKTLFVGLWWLLVLPMIHSPGEPWCDVLLVNGPGTAVIVVMICWIRRVRDILGFNRLLVPASFRRGRQCSQKAWCQSHSS